MIGYLIIFFNQIHAVHVSVYVFNKFIQGFSECGCVRFALHIAPEVGEKASILSRFDYII